MREIIIPNTCIRSSRLGFGTASLHHLVRLRERRALLTAALDSGFSHFDTAPMYGDGMAERDLGQFLGSARDRVTIATKIGFSTITAFERFPIILYAHRALGKIGRRVLPQAWNYRPRNLALADVEQSLARSLKALRTDWLDLLLVHEPKLTDVDALLDIAQWLEAQKVNGRVRNLGLAGSAANCVEVVRKIPGLFDVLQVEDSLSKYEADVVIKSGWPLQITFGYLRGAAVERERFNAEAVIKAALARNNEGMIIISTRNPKRLKILASLVDI